MLVVMWGIRLGLFLLLRSVPNEISFCYWANLFPVRCLYLKNSTFVYMNNLPDTEWERLSLYHKTYMQCFCADSQWKFALFIDSEFDFIRCTNSYQDTAVGGGPSLWRNAWKFGKIGCFLDFSGFCDLFYFVWIWLLIEACPPCDLGCESASLLSAGCMGVDCECTCDSC